MYDRRDIKDEKLRFAETVIQVAMAVEDDDIFLLQSMKQKRGEWDVRDAGKLLDNLKTRLFQTVCDEPKPQTFVWKLAPKACLWY